ncbi:MAG: hypothetical protein Q8Q95_01350 [bacterium]|nr:hypothetical protein [bacterium]
MLLKIIFLLMNFMYSRQLKYLDLVLKNNTIPHALLLYGSDFEYQINLAKNFLVKINKAEDKKQIEKEFHPDTLFISREEGKKEIGIAQIRKLKDFASLTSSHFKYKGIFIKEAEYLNEEAWNALLKTLEEPTGNTIFFILANNIKNIPKTIISRVVSLPFYNEDIFNKTRSPKDDIIVSKLGNVQNLTLAERIDLAEEIAKKENFFPVLDIWLIKLRVELLTNANKKDKAEFIENLAQAKSLLISTNVNARLVLENLFFKI